MKFFEDLILVFYIWVFNTIKEVTMKKFQFKQRFFYYFKAFDQKIG